MLPSLEYELCIVIMSSIGSSNVYSLHILLREPHPHRMTYWILHTILIRPLGGRLDLAQSFFLR